MYGTCYCGFNSKQDDDMVPYSETCSCNPKNGGSGICGCVMANTLVPNPKKYGSPKFNTPYQPFAITGSSISEALRFILDDIKNLYVFTRYFFLIEFAKYFYCISNCFTSIRIGHYT